MAVVEHKFLPKGAPKNTFLYIQTCKTHHCMQPEKVELHSTKGINNNNNNNSGLLLCAGIHQKMLMAQAIIITLSLSGNHQNHFAFN